MNGCKVKRSPGIDLLRLVALIAVIIGHVAPDTTREALYTWHVPVFFVLTGWFWKDEGTFRSELTKRTRTLLVPYLGWLLALVGLVVLLSPERWGGFTAADFVRGGAALGRPFSAFWFVTALWATTLLLRVLDRGGPWAPWVAATAGVAIMTIAPHIVAAIPLAFGTTGAGLLFVLLGRSARRLSERRSGNPQGSANAPLVLVLMGLLVLAATAIFAGSGPLDIKSGDLGTPAMTVAVAGVISLSLLGLAQAIEGVIPRKAGRWISQLAAVSTGVVLSHGAVLWVLDTPSTGRWWDLLWAVTIPFGLSLALHYSPLSPWFLGSPQARSQKRQATSGSR